MADPKVVGQWLNTFSIENVACHASLLPTGEILCWGRRTNPMSTIASLDELRTTAFLIDLNGPAANPPRPLCRFTKTQPRLFKSTKSVTDSDVNVFCSGHCFQPDGSLFVVGGHIRDAMGVAQACIYKPKEEEWIAVDPPLVGRWYPSALTLPDSSVFTLSGSHEEVAKVYPPDPTPQIWRNGKWNDQATNPVQTPPIDVLALYPRLFLDPFSRVFMAGPAPRGMFFDVKAKTNNNVIGDWSVPDDIKTPGKLTRKQGNRSEGAAVLYDAGKILWTGGGSATAGWVPTPETEIIDLNVDSPAWQSAPKLNFARRQHNATVLPDGSVLVTGGTQGPGFNNLDDGDPVKPGETWAQGRKGPVHAAELWKPGDTKWTIMAEEKSDRGYHGVALLLPDASVLSAGSGEGGSPWPVPNPSRDNFTNAQIFQPPYFFKKEMKNRPLVSPLPAAVNYGDKPLMVNQISGDTIVKVSWIRLPSVTHCTNMNQSVWFQNIPPAQQGKIIFVDVPVNRNITPPGHYMVFFVDKDGVPSDATGPFVKILPDTTTKEPQTYKPLAARSNPVTGSAPLSSRTTQMFQRRLPALDAQMIAEQDRPHATVGITPLCPYGLAPCFSAAYEGLHHISDIDAVRPVPDQAKSTAFVYLKQDTLPDIDVWRKEFSNGANGSHQMRGIELTLEGTVKKEHDELTLSSTSTRPAVVLAPFREGSNIEWDKDTKTIPQITNEERFAYAELAKKDGATVQVIGRIHKEAADKFTLDVRSFKVVGGKIASS